MVQGEAGRVYSHTISKQKNIFMNAELLRSILNGYENQLQEAEANKEAAKIIWLKSQIFETKKAIATCANYIQ